MSRYAGSITDANESDTYHIKLTAGKTYIIDLVAAGSERLPDPFLSIIGDNGQFAENNNGGRGRDAQIFFEPERTQHYDISVSGRAGSTGDYVLDVNVDDFRNGRAGVAPSGVATTDGRSQRGRINYEGDADYFAVSLIGGLSYNFRMLSGRDGTEDPKLTLLAADGRIIAVDDDSGEDTDALISRQVRKTGEYWLRAEDEGENAGTYGLRVSVGRGSPSEDMVRGTESGDSINVLGGDDDVRGGAGNDKIWGASGEDSLGGDDGADRIYGGFNGDDITGGLGSDRLFGESGRDHLDGGEGGDQLDGGEHRDRMTGGAGSDYLTGGLGNDRLDGGDGGDSLDGDDGNDIVLGGAGRDDLSGGFGDDRLDGGEGDDFADAGDGDDRVIGSFDDDSLYGGEGDDRLSGNEGDDYADGGPGNDRLSGGQGNDNLYGGEGDDVLRGGANGDFYNGAEGQDVFVFARISDSLVVDPDEINRFDRPGPTEGDLLDCSGIDADRTTSGNQTLVFGAAQEKGAVWLENDTRRGSTDTLVYINVDNDLEAEFQLRIFDGRALRARDYSESDFVL